MRHLLTVPLIALLGCSHPPTLLSDTVPEALLSVRAVAEDDVWVCGSDVGDGPALLHYDGSAWSAVDTSSLVGTDLWWIWPTAERLYLVGSGGFIGEYDRAADRFTKVEGTDSDYVFYGIWGASEDEIWAVGGKPSSVGPPALWRRSGGSWAAYDMAADGLGQDGDFLFKVHGASASDVWIVGRPGLAWHWDGSSWSATDPGVDSAPLLTVDVGPRGPIAVGGLGSAAIRRWDGATWVDESPEFVASLNGICSGGDQIVAVGSSGTLLSWDGEAWNFGTDSLLSPGQDYHGCLIEPGGDLWAVGGAISSFPLEDGVIVHGGQGSVPPAP